MLSRIVLASTSPRRLELLRSLGLQVEVRPSGYDEPDDPRITPLQLAIRHARAKVLDVARQAEPLAGAVIVAADTVVDLGGAALNKPADPVDAARMLAALSGREHRVHTAYAIAIPAAHPAYALTEADGLIEESSTARVRFYRLEPDEIAEYVAGGEPMDKAGAYGIQGRAASLVESIDGDFYTVMGFPLGRFVRTMRRLGFTFPSANPTHVT